MSKQTRLFGADEPNILPKLELAKAKVLASQIEESIKPLCDRLELVGSIRRQRPTVGDIDFVVLASDSNWAKISSTFRKHNVICSGKQLIKINYPIDGCLFQADFYRANEDNFGIQTLIRTGSGDHNIWLASYALSKGFRLKYSEGLLKDGKVIAGKEEVEVFTSLGLDCVEPRLREIVNQKPVWIHDA